VNAPDFLPVLPVAVLMLTASGITAVRLFRPGFKYFWHIAALGTLTAWLLMFLSRYSIGERLYLSTWRPLEIYPVSPQLYIDTYSWSFALALCTLSLAVVFTDTARSGEANWTSWVSNLVMTALGILVVQAGNLLTLVMLWTAIDLTEVVLLLGSSKKSKDRESIVIGFSARISGIILLIAAQLDIYSLQIAPDFSDLPLQANILLIASALLHMRYIAPSRLIHQLPPLIRSRSRMASLVAAAASFILITRTAVYGVPENTITVMLFLAGITSIFASLAWISSIGKLNTHEYWMLALASLIVAAAVRQQASAAMAWSAAALLPGGLLLLAPIRSRPIVVILLIGSLGITTLPYTPAWQGAYLYSSPTNPALILLLLSQSLLLVGFVRFSLLTDPHPAGMERWVRIIYPWGLVLIPLAHYLIAIGSWTEGISLENTVPSIIGLIIASVILVLEKKSFGYSRLTRTGRRIGETISQIFSFQWLFALLWNVYTILGKGLAYFIRVIEGDGGVLWGLLFLVLLITILTQLGVGF
jgi:hypothetical protein